MIITMIDINDKKNKVIVVGSSKSTATKLGYQSQTTIGGKQVISHSVITNKISLELRNIKEEQKNSIYLFWKKNKNLELITEKSNIYIGYIDSETLDFDETICEGEILYSTKFNFVCA